MTDEQSLTYTRVTIAAICLRQTMLIIQGIAAAAEQAEHSATDHETIIRADWRLLRKLATDALDGCTREYPDRAAISAALAAIDITVHVRTV